MPWDPPPIPAPQELAFAVTVHFEIVMLALTTSEDKAPPIPEAYVPVEETLKEDCSGLFEFSPLIVKKLELDGASAIPQKTAGR